MSSSIAGREDLEKGNGVRLVGEEWLDTKFVAKLLPEFPLAVLFLLRAPYHSSPDSFLASAEVSEETVEGNTWCSSQPDTCG